MKPSLLYPGNAMEKALRKGERTSFEVQDGEEERNYRWYQSKIDKLVDQGLVREALQLYVVGMKLENRIEPNFYTYRKLIEGCSSIGEMDRALTFYRRMRERDNPIDYNTYRALFKLCFRCKDRTKAVEAAESIWADLKTDGFHFGQTNNNSNGGNRAKRIHFDQVHNFYLKLLALHGGEKRAFKFYDEILRKDIAPTELTLNCLLIACQQDRADGFAKAVLIWKHFRSRYPKAQLTESAYRNLLYLILCNDVTKPDLFVALLAPQQRKDPSFLAESLDYLEELGLPAQIEASVRERVEREALKLKLTGGEEGVEPKRLDGSSDSAGVASADAAETSSLSNLSTASSSSSSSLSSLSPPSSSPSPSSDSPTSGSRLASSETASTPHDRISLLGGPEKFIGRMMASELSHPTPTTFALLLRTYPQDCENPAKEVLTMMDAADVRPDEEWMGSVCREMANRDKRNLTRVWKLMDVARVRGIRLPPNTFERFAGNVSSQDLDRFFDTMDEFQIEPTERIFEEMFFSTIRRRHNNSFFRKRVFDAMTTRYSMTPSDSFRKRFEAAVSYRISSRTEGEQSALAKDKFLPAYEAWLERNNLKFGQYASRR